MCRTKMYLVVAIPLLFLVSSVCATSQANRLFLPKNLLSDFDDSHQTNFKIDSNPNCPEASTYCESISSYPVEQVNNFLSSNNYLRDVSFVNEDSYTDARRGSTENQNTVCKSVRTIIRPLAAKNQKNKWRYIVNQEEKSGYVQELQVEFCSSSQSKSETCGIDYEPNHTTQCAQTYLLRRLLSFSDDGQLITDSFLFPSSCSCTFVKINENNDRDRRRKKKINDIYEKSLRQYRNTYP